MRYTSILFDLDGTLLDTLADLTAAMNRTLTRHGLPERTRQQMRTALGNGQCAVRNAAGGIQRRLRRPLPHRDCPLPRCRRAAA